MVAGSAHMSFLSFFCLSKTENGSMSCVPTAQQNKSLASVKDARLLSLVRETGLEPVKTGYKLLILLEIIRSVACFVSYSIMKNDQAHVMVISMLILPIW